MQLEIPSRSRRYPSLTSLIDIIFLLLLFFMLSSTFNKYTELDVAGALSGGSKQGEKPDFFVRMTQDGLKLNGIFVPVDELNLAMKVPEGKRNIRAILHVAKDVTSQEMMQVVEQFARLSVKVTVLH